MAVARLSRQTSGAPRIYSTSLWRRQAAAARPRQVTPAAILNDIRIKESAYDNASVVMLGAGNMGGAMLRGWLHSGVVPPGCLAACVRSERSQHAWRELGLQVSFTPPAAMCFENLVELKRSPCLILVSWSAPPDKIAEIFYEHLVFGDIDDEHELTALTEFADVIFLGVKPFSLAAVMRRLSEKLKPRQLIVSIAAGWSLAQLEDTLPPGTPVVKVMPNTPILVGEGACGYCLGTQATHAHRALVHELLASSGVAVEVSEEVMDAVIGVSGSGPAYMFQVLEAMADGGVREGLPRKTALLLAAQTMKGAAEMVLNSSDAEEQGKGMRAPKMMEQKKPTDIRDGVNLKHPGVLKDQVTSPGGTTIAALAVLEAEAVRSAFIKAVHAAAERSKEMTRLR